MTFIYFCDEYLITTYYFTDGNNFSEVDVFKLLKEEIKFHHLVSFWVNFSI